MLDAPGLWSTGPFTLVEGCSRISAEFAQIGREPFAGIWLQRVERTPRVRLVANPHYWNTKRGPHLQEVVFRNDLTPQQTLELVCTTKGEVRPEDAARVQASEFAQLVEVDAVRIVVGIINRDAEGLPLSDLRARQALNHAVDKAALVQDVLYGHAAPLGGLVPPTIAPLPLRLPPYKHDTTQARQLWQEACGPLPVRPLRLAAPEELEFIARFVTRQIEEALGVTVELTVYRTIEEKLDLRSGLTARTVPRSWDILIHETGTQAADAPPLELHRAFVGESGEYLAGTPHPRFEELYRQLVNLVNPFAQKPVALVIDKLVYDEVLALFLCTPHALYAVNKHVDFTAYRTTFELAECRVSEQHWSRQE